MREAWLLAGIQARENEGQGGVLHATKLAWLHFLRLRRIVLAHVQATYHNFSADPIHIVYLPRVPGQSSESHRLAHARYTTALSLSQNSGVVFTWGHPQNNGQLHLKHKRSFQRPPADMSALTVRSATVRKQNAYRHTVSDPVLEAGPTQKLVYREELGFNRGIKPSNRTEKLSPSNVPAALLLRDGNGR